MRLLTLRLPLPLAGLGLPDPCALPSLTLASSEDSAWAWMDDPPPLPVPEACPLVGEPAEGWDADHVVLLVPDLAGTLEALDGVGLVPRLRVEVRGRPTAFYRVGTLLEVVEAPVRAPLVGGVALVTDEPLPAVVLRWRALGFDVTDPREALQPGRRIATVRNLRVGLAVMSPDRALP